MIPYIRIYISFPSIRNLVFDTLFRILVFYIAISNFRFSMIVIVWN
nr:MAG TPA: hypothetical protein [Caudoviricetes sp.]